MKNKNYEASMIVSTISFIGIIAVLLLCG